MRYLWLLIFLAYLPRLMAEEAILIDPRSQKASIRLQSGEKILKSETSQGQWLRFCQGLGQNLLANNPSPGFLAEFSCQRQEHDPDELAEFPWRITFLVRPKFIDITIEYEHNSRRSLVQTFSFQLQGEFLEGLQKPSVLRFLARMIIESLPTGWVYTHKAESKNSEFIMHPDMPNLPNDLLIYQLSYIPDKNLWLPQLKGHMAQRNQFSNLEQGRAESFELSRSYGTLRDGEKYWIHNSKGRNQRQAEYEKKISEQTDGFSFLNLLDRMLFESLSSNFAGLRYGRSFVQGESVITKTSLISLLLELRSGPLAGLRWYYDLTPRIEMERQGLLEYFEMSRTSLGWAWEIKPPEAWQILISRIDLQPKIGMLNLHSQMAVQNSLGQFQPTAFDANRVLNLNLELGLEKETLWLRNRLWVSYSSAQASLVKSNGVAVTSGRIGFDAYVDVMKRGSWELKVLGFGLGERLALQRDTDSLATESDLAIKKLGFNLLFVGGGITVSW